MYRGWVLGRWWSYVHAYGLFRNIRLRIHKFSFEWDVSHYESMIGRLYYLYELYSILLIP